MSSTKSMNACLASKPFSRSPLSIMYFHANRVALSMSVALACTIDHKITNRLCLFRQLQLHKDTKPCIQKRNQRQCFTVQFVRDVPMRTLPDAYTVHSALSM